MSEEIKTSIRPAGYHVVVKPDKVVDTNVPEKTEGGIYIPLKAKERMEDERKREQMSAQTGVIAAVGPTAWKAYDDGMPWAQVGDHVCFAKFAGFELEDKVYKEKFLIMNDQDIKAVIGEAGV